MKKNYYDILGIQKNADASTIKKAYRKLAKEYHPDSNEGNAYAAERFKEVNEAYDVLGDEKKKKMYDQYGSAYFDGTAGGTHHTGNGKYQEYHFGSEGDMDDILKDIFGGGFGGGFKGYQSGRRYSKRGSDIRSNMEVSFDEAAFGGKKRIQFQGANGKVQSLEVTIPAGIADGKAIRLKGKGNPGVNGGESGDLLLEIKVHDKPGFHREGQDVYTTVNVPFATAVLGGEAKIATIYGDVVCKIKEGTQSGSKIRLKGKGIAVMGNPSMHGDQYVTVEIAVPQNLTEEAKQKLREFEKMCGGHVTD